MQTFLHVAWKDARRTTDRHANLLVKPFFSNHQDRLEHQLIPKLCAKRMSGMLPHSIIAPHMIGTVMHYASPRPSAEPTLSM